MSLATCVWLVWVKQSKFGHLQEKQSQFFLILFEYKTVFDGDFARNFLRQESRNLCVLNPVNSTKQVINKHQRLQTAKMCTAVQFLKSEVRSFVANNSLLAHCQGKSRHEGNDFTM